MDSAKLNDWVQVVGIFALVGSLIFVGLQMRQAHRIALSETYQARAIASSEFSASLASNSHILGVFEAAGRGETPDDSAETLSAARYMAAGVFFLYDNTHYQYTNGFVSEELWTSTRQGLKALLTNPLWRRFFVEREYRMRPSFREVFVEIQNEIDAESEE